MKSETEKSKDEGGRMKEEHALSSFIPHPSSLPTRLLIYLVLLYRVTLGHFLGGHCRFHPTCSQYAIDAIQKYGPWRGSWKAIRRIARCHPWGGKGYDPA